MKDLEQSKLVQLMNRVYKDFIIRAEIQCKTAVHAELSEYITLGIFEKLKQDKFFRKVSEEKFSPNADNIINIYDYIPEPNDGRK